MEHLLDFMIGIFTGLVPVTAGKALAAILRIFWPSIPDKLTFDDLSPKLFGDDL